jgi:uncharacterized protein YndB with AHSA1/START domain
VAGRPLEVVARRRYDAPAEAVFRAFTEPALLVRWFAPGRDTRLEILAHDLCVNGAYRFRYHHPTGGSDVVAGRFREISPPKRLAFTWTWEPPDPHAGIETLVTVELSAEAGGTRVAIRHERFPDRATRDRHRSGWSTTLPRLAPVLGASGVDRGVR